MMNYSTNEDKRFSDKTAYLKKHKCTIEWGYRERILSPTIPHNVAMDQYERLWRWYLEENPELIEELLRITEDHVLITTSLEEINQADALMSIANKIRNGEIKMARKKMSEVKESGGYINEAGTFEMEIVKCEEVTTSSGNTQYKIQLECEEGIVFDRVTMIEKAMGFVKRYLSACGYDIDDLEYEVEEKGKKKGMVTALYFEDKEYTLDALLEEETVMITTAEGDKSYRDPVDGTTKHVDNPAAKVKNVEAVTEEE